MAQISKYPLLSHLRSEPNSHVIQYRRGASIRSGRGLAFWFMPLSAGLTELPADDRDVPILFHGHSQDFQDVTTQGVITWRVSDPELLSTRVDFSINLTTGRWLRDPLDRIAGLLTQLAQQHATDYLNHTPVRQILAEGIDSVRNRIREGLENDPGLMSMGLEVVTIRISAIAPTSDVEKALQTPMLETIQQDADEATFQRRAMAVEKERAIQENELQNRIELARREEQLIMQQGKNDQQQTREQAEAALISAHAKAERAKLQSTSEAESIRMVETAKVDAESSRMAIYRELPTPVLMGLAAKDLAGNLPAIDHLNVTPEVLGPVLTTLMGAMTKKLENGNGSTDSEEV